MKTLTNSLAFLILIATTQAGPFGFQYGMTIEDIKKSGIKLEKSKTVPAEYIATNLPKEYTDWNSTVLVGITKKYGLVQIQVNKKIENNGKKNSTSKNFYDRYKEHHKINPGFLEERCDLYNLYPLLVHVRLFGSAYLGSVNQVLVKYGC